MTRNNSSDVLLKKPSSASILSLLTPINLVGLAESVLIIIGNLALFLAITSKKKLRRKELMTVAGLALADFFYAVAVFSGSIRRLQLGIEGRLNELVVPYTCMKELQSNIILIGAPGGSIMIVAVSIDRLLAIKFPLFYRDLNRKHFMAALGIIYGYLLASIPVVHLLSRFVASQVPSVELKCFTTKIGPDWFRFYQPGIQMSGGIMSVLIFAVSLYFFKESLAQYSSSSGSRQQQQANLKTHKRMTKIVGVTVVFTVLFYIIPHTFILVLGFINRKLASSLNTYAWKISNINNLANVFIFVICHREVRSVILSWISCGKVQFIGETTVRTMTSGRHALSRHTSKVGSVNQMSEFQGTRSHVEK